jgi:hypothetical protein
MPKPSLSIQCALVLLVTLMLLWIVPASADHHMKAAEAVKNVYICGCGPACGCAMVSDQPGSCPCGKPLIEKQVLREDADQLYVCACADDCRCAPNPADPAKCACGKELRAYPKQAKVACAHGMPVAADQPGCDRSGCAKPCCAKPCCAKPCGARAPVN